MTVKEQGSVHKLLVNSRLIPQWLHHAGKVCKAGLERAQVMPRFYADPPSSASDWQSHTRCVL